jgi:hypothetical protein
MSANLNTIDLGPSQNFMKPGWLVENQDGSWRSNPIGIYDVDSAKLTRRVT